MKFLKLTDLSQSFSFLEEEKPNYVWAFSLKEHQSNKPLHGIPSYVLEKLIIECQAWTGWGFSNGEPWLLFETQDDAMFARLSFGEITNVN
jgi:hypothetical protein